MVNGGSEASPTQEILCPSYFALFCASRVCVSHSFFIRNATATHKDQDSQASNTQAAIDCRPHIAIFVLLS